MKQLFKLSGLALAASFLVVACGGGSDEGGEVVLPEASVLCGSVGLQPKILNGANCAPPERSPVILLLVLGGDGQTRSCSGVLLTPNRVLTAAHCLPDGTRQVAAAQWKADGTYRLVNASKWVTHPSFSGDKSGFKNDAGVVTLKSGLSNPSMPLLVSNPSRSGDEVFISGWGMPEQQLAVGYARITKVNDTHVGFVYKGQASNTCTGDSGGPAYRAVGGRQGVVGLTSSGTVDGCGDGDNSLYTNIQTPVVLDFIRAQAPGAGEI